MDYKTFEANQIGAAPMATSEEALTTYYKCNKCGKVFQLFNDNTTTCKLCYAGDVTQISDFDYFAELRKGVQQEYRKELKKKQERETQMVDLIDVSILNRQKELRKNVN